MGLCASQSEEAKASRQVEKALKEAQRIEEEKVKLLLLGAGGCGKSTFFKQIKLMYGGDYTDEEIIEYKGLVNDNFRDNITSLMEQGVFGLKIEDESSELGQTYAKLQECGTKSSSNIGKEKKWDISHPTQGQGIYDLLKQMWEAPAIKEAFDRQAEFQLQDSTEYFFSRLDAIREPDYSPTLQDILCTRVRTSGIVEDNYKVEGNTFVVIDVGGQRNERKKWIHCFEEVTAIIFLAACSGYDKVLFEDNKKNRIHEATELFESLVNNKFFSNVDFIVFLNKYDLFQTKVLKKPINQPKGGDGEGWFTDYDGGFDCEKGISYIEKLFTNEIKFRSPETVSVYRTTATDSDNMKTVFDKCKEIIIGKNMESSGFA